MKDPFISEALGRLIGSPANKRHLSTTHTRIGLMTEETDKSEMRDEQGRLIAQAEYQNGKLDGVTIIWNHDGILIQEAHFRKGMREGSYRTWWDNGQKKEEGFYNKDAKVGLYIWYDDDGSVISKHDFGDGSTE